MNEINMISLVSFAFLVHVLIQKLQDHDRMSFVLQEGGVGKADF